MARKRFVLMIENKEIAFEALQSPHVAFSSSNGIEQHPATRYFVAAWMNEGDFHPTILEELGGNREHATAIVREWNRLERVTWIPEDSL